MVAFSLELHFTALLALLAALLLATGTAVAHAEMSGQCPACAIRSEIRTISLDAIKKEILTKLGMETAPNMTGRHIPDIPPLDMGMLDLPQADRPRDRDDSTTQRVISFARPHPRLRHWKKGVEIIYFKFSEKVQDSKVLKARLWVWMKDSSELGLEGPREAARVEVLRVTRPSAEDTQQLLLVDSRQERLGGGDRWVSLDVKAVVAHWFKYPRDNAGLVVRVTSPRSVASVITSSDDPARVPFVEVNMTEGGGKPRAKRMLGLDCQDNSTETKCCRYPLRVDFEEFGWDWVIAPKKYDAHYCSGECPFVFLHEYPHTHIAQMSYKSVACCAPRKLSSISMLYFDNELSIVYSVLHGMVVERCGCL